MERIGEGLKNKYRQLFRPKYTVVLHQVRDELGISIGSYCIFDSIHKLSHSNRDHVYCTLSKQNIGKFLGTTQRTVFRAIKEGLELGLIEKNERGDLRTTRKWVDLVEFYSIKGE